MKKEDAFLSKCSVARALGIIGGKWSLRVIHEVCRDTKRFGEFKKGIPEISEKMLIQELKFLTQNGILNRVSYPVVPPKVEYSLTDQGLKILPILDQIMVFGEGLMSEVPVSK